MKKFLFVVFAGMLFGVGCGSRAPAGIPKQDVSTEADLVTRCAPLQLSSGDYIFTVADAKNILGGEWDLGERLFVDPGVNYLHCAYYFNQIGNGQIIVQTVPPNLFPSADTAKPVFGLGTRAAFDYGESATRTSSTAVYLNLEKDNTVVVIVCRQAGKICSEDTLLKIGQTINSRWP